MRRWRATFYEVMDTDGSHWGYGSTGELARACAYEDLVDLYSDGGKREDPASALAWVGGRSLIRVTVEFEADEREARARGWRIVCGLLDMGGEDTPDAFLLAEVP